MKRLYDSLRRLKTSNKHLSIRANVESFIRERYISCHHGFGVDNTSFGSHDCYRKYNSM